MDALLDRGARSVTDDSTLSVPLPPAPWQPPAPSADPAPNDASSGNRLELNPVFLCRVAALPESALNDLLAREQSALLQQFHALQARVTDEGRRVSELLHTDIGRLEGRERSAALALRRRLFQGRPVTDTDVGGLASSLSAPARAAIESARAAITALSSVRASIQIAFDENPSTQASLDGLLTNESLRRGILLSSEALHSALVALASGARTPESSRGQRTVRGLLLYATRMALKTSPFGTLCSVIPGRVDPDDSRDPNAHPVRFHGMVMSMRSHVRLNKSLFAMITACLRAESIATRRVPLRLNSSLLHGDSHSAFVAWVAGKECIQRLPRASVEMIVELLGSGHTATLESLERTLVSSADTDSSAEEIVAYLSKLVACGLLVHAFDGAREEEWSLAFCNVLASLDDDEARHLASILSDLDTLRLTYARASLDDRARALAQARHRLSERKWASEYGAQLKMNLAFYEDATSDARAILDGSRLQAGLRALRRYLDLTIPLSWSRIQHLKLRHFFDATYGAGQRVPLVRFYEDFAKHRKRFEEQQKDGTVVADQVPPLVTALDNARRNIARKIQELWRRDPFAEELDLTSADLETEVLEVLEPLRATTSITVFCQVDWTCRGEWRLVVTDGRWQAGYGKYFSRFLHMFGDDAVENVRARNRAFGGGVLAEIGDDGAFNANLHPPLTDHEIVYPTAEPRRGVAAIPVSDLWVECATDNSTALTLHSERAGCAVHPVDLGFMSENLRPPLYQLLTLFCPSRGFVLPLPWTLERASEAVSEQVGDGEAPGSTTRVSTPNVVAPGDEPRRIVYRPRLVFDGHLVVARRRWSVAPGGTPGRDHQESLAGYAIRLSDWRRTHGIPEEVFVRIERLPTPSQPEAGHARQTPETAGPTEDDPDSPTGTEDRVLAASPSIPVGDDRKPQYIHFGSPLLVDMFARLMKRHHSKLLVIEERLPSATSLIAADDGEYVAELVLQFDALSRAQAQGGVPIDA